MLRRVYIDNFKCLINFELELKNFQVFCGANGSGKTAFFEALLWIRNFASGAYTLGNGPYRHLPFCFWSKSDTQSFELEFLHAEKTFIYSLKLQQSHDAVWPRVIYEKSACNDRILFERTLDGVNLPKPDGTASHFPLDWRQSALGAIEKTKSRADLEKLQNILANMIILRPNAYSMQGESSAEALVPSVDLSNIVSWYRYLSLEQDFTDHLRSRLQELWPDFISYKFQNVGQETKILNLVFREPTSEQTLSLSFAQLSEGEKMLFALYTIVEYLSTADGRQVFIDEPDNFVSVQELQPWLLSLHETIDDKRQALLITHNPEILNYAGEASLYLFTRDHHLAPTRVKQITVSEGLSVAEALARGWTDAV